MKINRTSQRTIKILELLSSYNDGLNLNEIARELDIPKTSTFDILQTLVHMNVVSLKDSILKKYSIGIKAFEIGTAYIKNTEFNIVAEKPLKELAQKVERTVFLGVENDGHITYLNKYEPKKPIITTANLGTKNPMYCTSLGKAILAAYDRERANSIIEGIEFEERTQYTITTKNELLIELGKIRSRGYSVDNRELEEHMFCVGAPIINHNNEVVAAISAVGIFSEKIDEKNLGNEVYKTALQISRELGFMAKSLYQL